LLHLGSPRKRREALHWDRDQAGGRLTTAPYDPDLSLGSGDAMQNDLIDQAAEQRFPLRLREGWRAPELREPYANIGKYRLQLCGQGERDHWLSLVLRHRLLCLLQGA
jgi:hypothetical protein